MNGLQFLKSVGHEFSADATYSAKDESTSLSRVKIGSALSIVDADNPKRVIEAVFASTGGTLATNGISDKIDGQMAGRLANHLAGSLLDDADLADQAIGQAIREETLERARKNREKQELIRIERSERVTEIRE